MLKQFIVELDGDSEIYQELALIVREITVQNPRLSMTEQQYVQNIVTSWLETRVRNEYGSQIQKLPIKDIALKLGKFTDIRGK